MASGVQKLWSFLAAEVDELGISEALGVRESSPVAAGGELGILAALDVLPLSESFQAREGL